MAQKTLTNVETSISALVSKTQKLETFLSNFSTIFNQNKIQICDFLYNCAANELFGDNQQTMLTLVYLKNSSDMAMTNYVAGYANVILSGQLTTSKYAVLLFLETQKITDMLQMDQDQIQQYLISLFGSLSSEDLDQRIKSKLQKLPKKGPIPPNIGFFVFPKNGDQQRYLEDPEMCAEVLPELRVLTASDSLNWKPDLMLPIPSEISLTADDFCTPFPLIVESPILNPVLPYQEFVNYAIECSDTLNETEIKVDLKDSD